MKFNSDKNAQTSALLILLIGVVLGATILFWEKDGSTAPAPHAEQSGDHAGEDGVIVMNAKQIQTAGVAIAEAGSATMGNVVQLPGEIRFNEDLTAHIVPATWSSCRARSASTKT